SIFQYLSKTIKDLMDIVKKLEEKDVYTKDHSSRLQYYCLKIARKLKISNDNLESIALSAYFHDLGKINVPDYILNKPGKLAREEFEKIKKHPEDGFNMVKETMLRPVAEIIKQHHERLDGSGYPLGLKGKEILIEAKIIAVVDSYDAMTSDRSYRKAVTSKEAMEDLWSLSGTKYDEDVVKALEEVLIEEGILHGN
ncbi:MAG: HD-GYP domain-containing protein, partial [Lutispora sp.]|nr:HD-GYP domain-containing protein [Lutispora sp.]